MATADTGKLPEGYSQDDFNLLTEEEQQGLLEQALDEAAELAAGAGDGADSDDPDTGADSGARAGADAGADTGAAEDPDKKPTAAAAAAAAEDVATPAADADTGARQAPPRASTLPNWTAPADIDKRITDTKTARRDLFKKFDDGELTSAEYNEQIEKLDDELDTLKETKMRAGISEDTRKHNFLNRDVPTFLNEHAEYVPGSGRYRELDRHLRELQSEASKAGKDPLDPQLIADAHTLVEKEWGPAAGAKPAPKAPAGKEPPARRPAAPPTLGGLPSADAEDAGIDGGEYAYLDRLQGEEYEAAFAKLTPAQQEEYLQQ